MYPFMAYSAGMSGLLCVIGTGLLTLGYQGLVRICGNRFSLQLSQSSSLISPNSSLIPTTMKTMVKGKIRLLLTL